MTDYIDREALIERLTRNLNACNPGTFSERCYQDAINTVTFSPAADEELVKHGRWVGRDIEHMWFRCSQCGKEAHSATTYCPNCGAKMDLEVNRQ